MIRALIVDDEPLARERIRTLLADEPEIEVVGECADGAQALTAIEETAPDLLFLDVQMPDVDGFTLLQSLRGDEAMVVVFVTAYDEYALKAFDVHALDYLLKPFDAARFRQALARARHKLEHDRAQTLDKQVRALLEDITAGKRRTDRLVVRSGGRVVFLRPEEIDWIDATGNYVRLHVGAETYQLRETMKVLESRLNPERFLRIHRSVIINVERIKELEPWFHGAFVVILHDGTRLISSRSSNEKLRNLLKQAR
ncbi:MAG TPA: LytTR family DNA-binding domain-containing protein [Gemmatimonadaceae bacterium]|nr:LytTR family DNA-binding domain-containing protein [Gemmatimonadaceae bacterium]